MFCTLKLSKEIICHIKEELLSFIRNIIKLQNEIQNDSRIMNQVEKGGTSQPTQITRVLYNFG